VTAAASPRHPIVCFFQYEATEMSNIQKWEGQQARNPKESSKNQGE
jgi:hypothetical protein